jgi:signal transduction histidine kinase
MLSEFLTEHREQLIERARVKVVRRRTPRATDYVLLHGVPLFLDQLVQTLRLEAMHPDSDLPEMGPAAVHHGGDLLQQGFTGGPVGHDYGDICQAVTELAQEVGSPITILEFHTLNRCLDNVTAEAVTEYGRLRDLQGSDAETERLGFFSHELRNLIQTAVLAFRVLRGGSVGPTGRTSEALERTLAEMGSLVDRALAEVRFESKIGHRTRLPLAGLIDEVAFPAALAAEQRGLSLLVQPVAAALAVEADRQLLAAAVSNLLQNALKFTAPASRVWLRALESDGRVLIEVEDQCGGLPEGAQESLFLPFTQRSGDRTGLGLGLAISRRAVEQSGGTLRVRDLPGKGCVFTITLPVAPPDPA